MNETSTFFDNNVNARWHLKPSTVSMLTLFDLNSNHFDIGSENLFIKLWISALYVSIS